MERQKIWAREPSLASILAALSELSPMVGRFLGFRCAPPQASPLAPSALRSVDFLDVKKLREEIPAPKRAAGFCPGF